MGYGAPVDFGELVVKIAVEFLGQFGVGGLPCSLLLAACLDDGAELLAACLIESLHVVEDDEGVPGVCSEIAHGGCEIGTCGAQGLPVGRALALIVLAVGLDATLAHHGMSDDYGGTLGLVACCLDGSGYGLGIVAVDLDDIPVPCAILGGDILGVYGIDHGRELNLVRVIEHDEVGQAQVSGEACGALRDFLLDTAVRDEGVCLVREPLAKTCCKESLGNCAADGHGVALAQGTRCVLDTTLGMEFGVTRSGRPPLAELGELVGGIVAEQRKHAVEHRRHVARIEEEAVAGYPPSVVGIGHEELRIEHIDKVCASHGTAGMSRLGFLNHRGGESADVVRRTVDCS